MPRRNTPRPTGRIALDGSGRGSWRGYHGRCSLPRVKNGPDIIVCGRFVQGLVDGVVLAVYPLLLGRGKRFFSDAADAGLAFV